MNSTLLFLSGSGDGSARFWYVHVLQRAHLLINNLTRDRKGSCVAILKGHERRITCLKIWTGRLFTGSQDKTVRVWTRTGQCLQVLSDHDYQACSLRIWKGLLAGSGWWDKRVCIWTESGLCVHTAKTEGSWVIPLRVWKGYLCAGTSQGIQLIECRTDGTEAKTAEAKNPPAVVVEEDSATTNTKGEKDKQQYSLTSILKWWKGK